MELSEVPPGAIQLAVAAKWLGRVTCVLVLGPAALCGDPLEAAIWIALAAFSLWLSLAMHALATYRHGIPSSKRWLVPAVFEASFRKHFVDTDDSERNRRKHNLWVTTLCMGIVGFGLTWAHGAYLPLAVVIAGGILVYAARPH